MVRHGLFSQGPVTQSHQVNFDRKIKLPKPFESLFVKSSDGERLEVIKASSTTSSGKSEYVALYFHGNGDTLTTFYPHLNWLLTLGIDSYAIGYRGYGYSSGSPSEKGIYLDAEALWKQIREVEGYEANKIILIGISLGSGPATYLAEKYQPGLLMLFSAFASIKDVASQNHIYRLISPFVKHNFPNVERMPRMGSSNIFLVHGENDRIVPFSSLDKLYQAYRGTGICKKFEIPNTGHNDILSSSSQQVAEEIRKLFNL